MWSTTRPSKLDELTDMPPQTKKELQSFLGIMNYLKRFSPPSTEELCEPLRKLTSAKSELKWNSIYHKLYKRAKLIIKKHALMKFLSVKEQLYLETDMMGVDLGECILQVRDGMWLPKDKTPENSAMWPIAVARKSLTSAETLYSNIKGKLWHTPWIREIAPLLLKLQG